MVDTPTLLARLAEAEAALHAVLTGTAVVKLSHGDKSVEYTAADASALRAYINELKSALGTGGRTKARGVVFG